MTSLADRTISALRELHDELAAVVPQLSGEQLRGPSGASEWPVAQVLSHLGSGAEISLHTYRAALDAVPEPDRDFNASVWDRWNAKNPQQQADDFLSIDAELVGWLEALTAEQRENTPVKLGFLPGPLPLAGAAGMRLNEVALHSWDVRVALDSGATVANEHARLLLDQLAGDLGFLLGFVGKADVVAEPVVLELVGIDYRIAIEDGVRITTAAPAVTATFSGPADSAVRLIGGRLTESHTPATVAVSGNTTLDDLRRVFPGF